MIEKKKIFEKDVEGALDIINRYLVSIEGSTVDRTMTFEDIDKAVRTVAMYLNGTGIAEDSPEFRVSMEGMVAAWYAAIANRGNSAVPGKEDTPANYSIDEAAWDKMNQEERFKLFMAHNITFPVYDEETEEFPLSYAEVDELIKLNESFSKQGSWGGVFIDTVRTHNNWTRPVDTWRQMPYDAKVQLFSAYHISFPTKELEDKDPMRYEEAVTLLRKKGCHI